MLHMLSAAQNQLAFLMEEERASQNTKAKANKSWAPGRLPLLLPKTAGGKQLCSPSAERGLTFMFDKDPFPLGF